MNVPIVPGLVLVATIMKRSCTNKFAFARPDNGESNIMIHINQFCQVQPSLDGNSFEFFLIPRRIGLGFLSKVVICRTSQEFSDPDYTKASAWCYLDYFYSKVPEEMWKIIFKASLPSPPPTILLPVTLPPRNGKHFYVGETLLVNKPPYPKVPGEHFSAYREKKRRKFAEAQ